MGVAALRYLVDQFLNNLLIVPNELKVSPMAGGISEPSAILPDSQRGFRILRGVLAFAVQDGGVEPGNKEARSP
jgi:hypothetical protein